MFKNICRKILCFLGYHEIFDLPDYEAEFFWRAYLCKHCRNHFSKDGWTFWGC